MLENLFEHLSVYISFYGLVQPVALTKLNVYSIVVYVLKISRKISNLFVHIKLLLMVHSRLNDMAIDFKLNPNS